jgi:hypothetical protein
VASFDTQIAKLHPDDREPAMAKINRSIEEKYHWRKNTGSFWLMDSNVG